MAVHSSCELSDLPLVSIITVTKNSANYLEDAIKSVISQDYPNIEYLIYDGLSEDTTVEIIRKYEAHIDYWVSEEDASMYDAINKAILHSKGDIVAILNSDDRYVSNDTVSRVVRTMQANNADGVYGDLVVDYGKYTQYKKVFQVTYYELLASGKGSFLPHPTLYLRRKFIDVVGLYDLNYRFASDYDFILRCLRKLRISYSGFAITIFRRHGDSITSSGKIKAESKRILKKYEGKEYRSFMTKYTRLKLWFKYYMSNAILKARQAAKLKLRIKV